MSLMNGVDSEEIIAEKVGAEHLLHAVIKVASHKENDGYVSTLRRRSASFSKAFWICGNCWMVEK